MKLVHLVDFIIKKFVTMHGHMNVKFVTMHGHMYVKFVTMHGHMNVKFITTTCPDDLLLLYFE